MQSWLIKPKPQSSLGAAHPGALVGILVLDGASADTSAREDRSPGEAIAHDEPQEEQQGPLHGWTSCWSGLATLSGGAEDGAVFLEEFRSNGELLELMVGLWVLRTVAFNIAFF